MKQVINIGEFTVTLEVVSGALVTTVEQAKSIEQPKEQEYVTCMDKYGDYWKEYAELGFPLGSRVKIVKDSEDEDGAVLIINENGQRACIHKSRLKPIE